MSGVLKQQRSVCLGGLPPFVVSFCDWMPCWILEWIGVKRSAAWATSFWASATELVWGKKGVKFNLKVHLRYLQSTVCAFNLCVTSFLVKVISAVSRSRVNLILLKSAKHCWCWKKCQNRINWLTDLITYWQKKCTLYKENAVKC